MKLIKVETHGFKSFADPVTLRFDGGVVGVVGPNGSGKSNINDAIKWVLGEQSSKELRGDNMQDVIFSGSKIVPAMNKASVKLTFEDPQEGVVTIERVIQRGKGLNQYFMNNKPALHSQIKALAMQSGIGKSSLAIISQGTVSEIAQSSDEQRRGIFEEAAGVSKYKTRKEEAIKKLEKSEGSLRNINTSINELERQLEPLRKQAEKAIKYRDKSRELKEIEIGYLAHEIERLSVLSEELNANLEGVQETKESYENDIEEITKKIDRKKIESNELNNEINKLAGVEMALNQTINNLERSFDLENQRLQMIARGELNVDPEQRKKAIFNQIEQLTHQINYYKDIKNDLESKLEESKTFISQKNALLNERRAKFESLNKRKISYETQLRLLKEKQSKRTNLFKGTRTILENKSNFRGFKGIVADLIEVESKYSVAIETILSNALQHIVVDNSDTAVKAINFLKANNGGRSTFIPLTSIKEKGIRDDYLLVLRSQPGFVGIASDLVKTKPEFAKLAQFLLGNVIVVDKVDLADKISVLLERKYMVVSMEGDIVRPGGVMVGGVQQESEELLGLDRKIQEMENELPGINSQMSAIQTEIENLATERNQKEHYFREYSSKISANNVLLENANAALEEAKVQASSFGESVQNVGKEAKVNDALEDLNKAKRNLSVTQFDLSAKRNTKATLDDEINALDRSRNDLYKNLKALNNSYRSKIEEANRASSTLAVHKERLSEFYKLTLEFARENFPLQISVEAAGEIIADIRSEIAELGNVNLESIEQLEEVESRYNKLTADRDELVEAKNAVIEAIAELDKIIITRLTNVVHDINLEFNNVFSSMFGGGSAKVEFVDPKNVLESGISIFAQPPGKSIKNLKLFSGGEKSLIAISLLFAILKARPLPLCILDEVEAALDESNVVRFAEYLQQLKHQTQFIVITHRHGTMTRVDHLFGATMQKRGVTSFFTVKIEDAKKLIDEAPEA